ncbi:MAG: septum formation initiator family protein [Synergistaceae bacterium]|jgi:cell division protein FtsB|nr:septum formation initiator family protein [Synergistaceae bacterium]
MPDAPRIRWIIVYAVALFLVAVSVVTFFKEVGRIERLSMALGSRMEELVVIMRKNQDLQEKISYYKTPDGIRRLAIDQFNLVKSGEKIYRIVIISDDALHEN